MEAQIKKINRNYYIILSAIILAFFVLWPSSSFAITGLQNALSGLNTTAEKGYGNGGYTKDLPATIGQIVGGLLAFLGVIFLGLMIYGGFIWMTARGNDQLVAKAKDLITAAVIGLIIILAAYAITSYIGKAVVPGT